MPTANETLAARRILSVTEEELQHIILNIHDGPVQKLFAALAQLSLLQAQLTANHAADTSEAQVLFGTTENVKWLEQLNRVAGLIEAALGEIRTTLGTLRPPEFARRDVVQMLEGLLMQHMELTGMQVKLQVEGETPRLALPVKIALYRIVQEALSNTYRHAEVTEAMVRLTTRGECVRLEVIDHGRGFAPPPLEGPAATERAEHIGLRGMRERASLVGGSLWLEAQVGRGTRILVEAPLEAHAAASPECRAENV